MSIPLTTDLRHTRLDTSDRKHSDSVDHPAHYTSHPSGIECIQVTEHMGFNLGNAVKYVWRADLKGDAIEDLRKARWYIDREIARREPGQARPLCRSCGRPQPGAAE